MEDSIESLKAILVNPATPPSYRQVVERRLQELQQSTSGRLPEAAPVNPPQRSAKYQGVANMTLDEIVAFFSQGRFYRLDTPITGLDALQTRYRLAAVLGYDRATVERIAAAIQQLGGELPEMEQVKIEDLLKRE